MPTLRRASTSATALAAAVLASLAVPTGAHAEGGVTTSTSPHVDVKRRAVESLADPARALDTTPATAPREPRIGLAPEQGDPGAAIPKLAPGDTPIDGARASRIAGAVDCAVLALDVTPTNDRVWVHWDPTPAQQYEVWRLRQDGDWRLVTTTSGTEFEDSGVNPDAVFTYLVVADDTECYLDRWVTMGTPDGWGVPDVVYGGGGGNENQVGLLMVQEPWSEAVGSHTAGVDPSYSADGRMVVLASRGTDGQWRIETALTFQAFTTLTSHPVGDGFLGAEPAWAPDGRSVVYTRYALAGNGTVSSPELHVLDPRTGTDRAVPGGQGLVQAQWRSSTTLVAAGWNEGEGLYTVPASGGTPAVVPGTSDAAYPEVAPDGTIWFVTGDGASYGVSTVSPGGVVTARATSSTGWWERPRVAPDGTVFTVRGELNDPDDPADDTLGVVRGGFGTPAEQTAIGVPVSDGLPGFAGFDVRQPRSKGTSDFAGDASGDILARDASGTMWVFPSSPDAFTTPRRKVSSGWNIYTSFIAAGDLNSDDRGDVVAKDKAGYLWFYAGRGNGKLAPRKLIGSGWGSLSYLAPGDIHGTGTADLLAVKPDGTLWVFSGQGTGTTFAKPWLLGSGFANLTVIGVGDFNYDNTADLLSRDRSTGRLYLNAGRGDGKFTGKKLVGTGWAGFTGFGTPEFDGATGLYARGASGSMRFYGTVGDGVFAPGYATVDGSWKAYLFSS